jgi:ELWxxDGT repeat protein
VQPGPGEYPSTGAYPSNILALGDGRALFSADDNEAGRELWITDGTAAGTLLLADIWAGGGSGNPGSGSYSSSYQPGRYYPPYPPYFLGSPGGEAVLSEGRAVFSATDPERGTELWVTDGTAEGTRLVRDINENTQGFASSTPSQFAAFGDGRAIFTADDGENGPAPWITDGTEAGTVLLRSFMQGPAGSYPGGYVALGEDAAPAGTGVGEASLLG